MNACKGCNVNDAVLESGISRSAFHKHVMVLLGHSPHEEIRRIQLQHARVLLQDSLLSVRDISARCGFKDDSYFVKVFSKEAGCTPTEFRRRKMDYGFPLAE